MYININTHSYYSLLESTLSIEAIIAFAKKENQQYVFLTDSNLYGSIEFSNQCEKAGLIPIIGLDIFYQEQKLLIFPCSDLGYKNLIKISSNYLQRKNFDINNYSKDLLFIFDGNKPANINTENYFTTRTNLASDLAVNEVRHLSEVDDKLLTIMYHIKNDLKVDTNNFLVNNLGLLDCQTFQKKFSKANQGNYETFIKKVSWTKKAKVSEIIAFPIKEKISASAYLRKLCQIGLLEKFANHQDFHIYEARMNHELDIIDSMGFNDYFLIVHDFIAEAKNRDILVGPGRGSSSGSLVSFLLSITKIDPIKYDLIFERFLNPNRKSLPDIDIDIMDNRREEIIDYIFDKYGYDHVAHIVTFQRIKAKMAIRDVGRVLDIDLKIINRISKLIASDYDYDLLAAVAKSKELKDFYHSYQELFDFAHQLIGAPRQTGIHAAGIVLSKDELTDVIPIQYSANDITTTQISMDYLEPLGLLKMDLLGLSNLTIIHNVLRLIAIKQKMQLNLDQLPLDDHQVYEEISKANTLGIFQLESPGMRATLKKIRPRSLEDISLVSALFRPGPQKNIPTFVERRFSNQPFDPIDERIKDILVPTNGIIVYQEQVIQIVQRVANFSPADADIFRKIISKKEPKEMELIKEKFINSSIANNYSAKLAEKIFDYIEKFASYGFNHCHSISYALISYWMVYLKIKFPLIFMSVLLKSAQNSHDKIYQYCLEALRMNLLIHKPSINLSSRSFKIINQTIFFGLTTIKGIGFETAKKIIDIRDLQPKKKFVSYESCIANLTNGGIGESTLETLICAGTFDEFELSKKYMVDNLKEAIDASKNMTKDNEYLFAPHWKSVEETSLDQEEFIKKEISLIGFDFSKTNNDDFNKIKEQFRQYQLSSLSDVQEGNVGQTFHVLVKIVKVTPTFTKQGKEMAFVQVMDNFTKSRFATFNYNNLKDRLIEDKLVIIYLRYSERGSQIIGIDEVVN
ncbi:MAG: DNA polymerase III subunit alpha [Mycoplasmoidaceae bacterium]